MVESRPPISPAQTPTVSELIEGLNQCGGGRHLDALQYLFASKHAPVDVRLADYARESLRPDRNIFEGTAELTGRIFEDFRFDPRATTVATPVAEFFERRSGVCQDFAHLQIACMRSIGVPARYVSGYLRTTPPPGSSRLVGADASHAWLSVYCGEVGWVDFDPTNNLFA